MAQHSPELRTRRWARLKRQILKRDGYRCQQCGGAGRLEIDHIVPVSAGGGIWDGLNLQTLDRGCHVSKTQQENQERIEAKLSNRALRWRAIVEEMVSEK